MQTTIWEMLFLCSFTYLGKTSMVIIPLDLWTISYSIQDRIHLRFIKYCLLDVMTLNKVGLEYFPNINAHLFLTQDSYTYKTIIALLCTIVYLTLCAHKYNHEKVVIKNSQKRKGQSRLYMYGKKFCKIWNKKWNVGEQVTQKY